MSTATIQQLGQDLPAWLAAVQRGETVAILDGGREVARLTPPDRVVRSAEGKAGVRGDEWARQRLADLEASFPKVVHGASAALEEIRADSV